MNCFENPITKVEFTIASEDIGFLWMGIENFVRTKAIIHYQNLNHDCVHNSGVTEGNKMWVCGMVSKYNSFRTAPGVLYGMEPKSGCAVANSAHPIFLPLSCNIHVYLQELPALVSKHLLRHSFSVSQQWLRLWTVTQFFNSGSVV